jgi:hypothetical protein
VRGSSRTATSAASESIQRIGRLLSQIPLLAICLLLLCASCAHPPPAKESNPSDLRDYLDLIVTQAIHAKTLWHTDPAGAGGYWGPVGIAEANQNGAVRGMTGTMLGYATLVHALDNHWLADDLQKQLAHANLDRATLLHYIEENLTHITAHHKSAPHPLEPSWGFWWQSAMWTGNAGPAVLLVYHDLPPDLLNDFKRVAFAEADRIASKPPKDYKPGDTGAEENGWDSYAPAVALALDPHHPRADAWKKALALYALNTYSIKADHQLTANLFDDFTLENHGFFHPDYVQVSADELGQSLLFLEMGDRLHGTHLARELRPYLMHHVQDVWEKVARPLVLPTGEFAFPNGTDWQLNCSMMPSYFAYIATQLHDPLAYQATLRIPKQALRRRALSPPPQIFGDTNMEWFWDPILAERFSISVLEYALHPFQSNDPAALDDNVVARYFPNVKVWMYRNQNYFASAAWGDKKMGTFTPFVPPDGNPYITIPIESILPADVDAFESQTLAAPDQPQILTLRLKDHRRGYLICLPNSVLWLSPMPLRPLAIQNDKLAGGHRDLYTAAGTRTVPALTESQPFNLKGWLNIDNTLALISTGSGFRYTPTKKYNRRSFAYETIEPIARHGAWQMIPKSTAEQTVSLAHDFQEEATAQQLTLTLHDGPAGPRYRIVADLSGTTADAIAIERLDSPGATSK